MKRYNTQERLRQTPAAKLEHGDHVVVPGFLATYAEDAEGWASYRADSGTRYEIQSNANGILSAKRLDNGAIITQAIPGGATLLKVFET
ncbi:Uncharacterised protein [Mycobacteroides abscessus]|uniref:Uncharacterized protein n=5 Tax=Mycobacteroides TaxID=670516 RepID=A0AB74FAB5_9MYCO|nr:MULTISPECIES: hypothetical protein [Mycobacteroides]EUA69869.1 hypothetical protein I540_3085 [Mycobacteroides abscessus subsp. bolletii 1513]AMU26551.1 hypothetical protein A3N96_14910 [Mycobacteroides abscessus]AMU36232.1 hypothetical protein A3N98_14105 [Mycobacteroides abscessus]AMU41279.1 hypothetical protein A3N99_14700 [Mycobacteroides abscessus]AMU61255.1 hypothetical protein A3O03_14820 [Mycobacteroides abscessus]